MSGILLVMLIAAMVWKPTWAFYRKSTTKKGAEKVSEYEKRIADWMEAIPKVFW